MPDTNATPSRRYWLPRSSTHLRRIDKRLISYTGEHWTRK